MYQTGVSNGAAYGYGGGGGFAGGGGGFAGGNGFSNTSGAGYGYGHGGAMHMGAGQGSGVIVQGPNGGVVGGGNAAGFHGGAVSTGAGVISGGPGMVVDPGYGQGSGACDIGSGCCGPSGVIVAPGAGVGVDSGYGVSPPGSGCGGVSCIGGPDVACGGVGSACCEPAGALVTNAGWTFVGPGAGDHNAGGSYSYVGMGSGAYVKEVSTTFYGWKLRPCCLALLCLLLLLPLLWLLWPQGGETESVDPLPIVPGPTPTQMPSTPIGVCTVFGDPHLMTFDGVHADYYSSGEYWIVKSQTIAIQGRYLPTKMTNGLAVTKMVAIGGPLLKGHKIFVSATTASIDGRPILTNFPSTYSVPGVVEMSLNGQGELLQKGRQGMELHVVHVKIFDGTAENILIQINRWTRESEGHYVNVRITMHAQPGQDGHCGNFNGNKADDDRIQVRARLGKTGVPVGELLFHTKTPVVATPNRPNINDCATDKLASCSDTCKKERNTPFPPPDCLVDCCFAGAGFVKQE